MLARDFDWRSGRVTSWDLDDVDPKAVAERSSALKEDLAQVEYPYDVTLDVAWYRNAFAVVVVYGSDWERPALRRHAESLSSLADEIREAIDFAEKLSASVQK